MVERLRAQLRHVVWGNILAWLAVLGLLAGGLFWQDRRDAGRQREICGLIILTDDSYRQHPASGQGGQAFAAAVHEYRRKIGCPATPAPPG